MAIPCQGFTITWGGAAIQEAQELSISEERGLPLQRNGTWTLTLGTIRIAGFSTANLSQSEYGRRKQLTVQCPSGTAVGAPVVIFFDRDCILMDRVLAAQANDAVRVDHVFRIMDTTGAPTNP
jgi:hypothetical protein